MPNGRNEERNGSTPADERARNAENPSGRANEPASGLVYTGVVSSEEATMTIGHPIGLQLTEEEAFALLGLCMTSPQRLDAVSEKALTKLAIFCKSRMEHSNHSAPAQCELDEAG